MPSQVSFTSNEGIEIINSIVKKNVLKWNKGLREFQRICIPKILNPEDLFAIEAIDGGKSALFGVCILKFHRIYSIESSWSCSKTYKGFSQ